MILPVFSVVAIFALGQETVADQVGTTLPQVGRCILEREVDFPSAASALTSLQSRKNLGIDESVKRNIWAEFCMAAKEMRSKHGFEYEAMDSKVESVLSEYVSREADPHRTGKSIESILGSRLSVPGLSRPQIKSYGVVEIRSEVPLEKISINERFEPVYKKYLVPPGQVKIKGYLGEQMTCFSTLSIAVNEVEIFECGMPK